MGTAWWSFQPFLKRKQKNFSLKDYFHQRAPIWQEIPLLHPPAIGSPWSWCWSCPLSTISQRMVGAHHVSPQQSIKNILVWSQPRSLGCYTTGLLNESGSKNPLGSFVPSAAFSSVHISSHSLLTLFEIWDSFWISAGFMTKRWHQFMLEKACFAPL